MRRPALLAALVLALTWGMVACGNDAGDGSRPTDDPAGTGVQLDGTPLSAESEHVSIVIVEDEIILDGRLFGRNNRTGVILSHMQPNDQTAWYPFAERLADEGYAVLAYDFRGHGASQGEKDYEKLDDDLREALRFMTVDRGLDRVFLIGASMGATTSLVVAAEQEVAGVVAISPPAEFEGQDALAALPAIEEPALLIASEDDAPSLSFDELLAVGGDHVQSQVFEGAAHGTALFEAEGGHPAEMEELVLSFLREASGS